MQTRLNILLVVYSCSLSRNQEILFRQKLERANINIYEVDEVTECENRMHRMDGVIFHVETNDTFRDVALLEYLYAVCCKFDVPLVGVCRNTEEIALEQFCTRKQIPMMYLDDFLEPSMTPGMVRIELDQYLGTDDVMAGCTSAMIH